MISFLSEYYTVPSPAGLQMCSHFGIWIASARPCLRAPTGGATLPAQMDATAAGMNGDRPTRLGTEDDDERRSRREAYCMYAQREWKFLGRLPELPVFFARGAREEGRYSATEAHPEEKMSAPPTGLP
jgi:hypothetical protein